VVTRQPQVERRTGKVRLSETDVLPLSHATNLTGDWTVWRAGAAQRILRWGYKTGFASGTSEKKICTPTFPNVGVQASNYQ